MSFSTDMAKLIADQLSRFATLNRHQLAGQAANLDFWLAQVRHGLGVLDGYGVRFVQMHSAQEQYVAAQGVLGKAAPPRRVPDREIRQARRALTDAAYRFLARCRQEGFVSGPQLSEALARLGMDSEGEPVDR